ncbi:MAG: hypothetical protein ACRENB_08920 [Gemmatimonadales bacterium]
MIYVLGVVPSRDASLFEPVFARMLRSLQVHDEAAHRNTISSTVVPPA